MNATMDAIGVELLNKLDGRLSMLDKDPANIRLRSECVELALRLRKYDIALHIADSALEKNPADTQARFERASALMGLRQFDAALDELHILSQFEQVDPAVLQNMGLCHYLLGNFEPARSPLEIIYNHGVRSTDLLRLFISTLHHLGDIATALAVAETADEFAVNDEALAGVLGLLYLDANQPQKAASWSARSLARNPNSLDSLVVQGTLRAGAFDLPTAKQQFEHVLSIAPNAGRAWIGLALVSMAQNDFAKAKAQTEQAVKYMPGHVGSWHVLAWIHLIEGRLDEAQTVFEHALSLNRNFAESHGGLAAVAALRGDRESANRLAEVAERLDSKCLSAKFARSTLQKGAGDTQAARNTLLTAISGISPRDGGALSRIIDELKKR